MNGTGNGKPESNQGQIQIIVRTLAIVLGICVLGIFVLLFYGRTIPTELWMLTSNSFTALATMLVKTTPTSAAPTPQDQQKPAGSVTVPEQKLETTA